MPYRLSLGRAHFKTSEERFGCYLPVTRQAKEQAHVDIYSFADELPDGGQSFRRRRDYDGDIGPVQGAL